MASRLRRRIGTYFQAAGAGAGTGAATGVGSAQVGSAIPAVFPLELVSPRAAGTSPVSDLSAAELAITANQNTVIFDGSDKASIPSFHRIFKAYPGIEYNIRAQVIGGSYPFAYSLSGAPSGMTINADTGEISWTPSAGTADGTTYTPTISVRDSEGTTRSSAWTVTVTTSGFYFVDASASPGGSGTLASPFDTLAALFAGSTSSTAIVYFKNGTYTPSGIATTNSGINLGIELSTSYNRPRNWLAYPGHAPVYDGGGVLIQESLHGFYIDGLTVQNTPSKLIRHYGGGYKTIRRCTFRQLTAGVDGENPSANMFEQHYGTYDYYVVIQDCVGTNFAGSSPGGLFKLYSKKKTLIEDCYVYGTAGASDPKAACPRYEIRGCRFDNSSSNQRAGVCGNYDPQLSFSGHEPVCGEVRYNRIDAPSVTLAGYEVLPGTSRTYVYRNTFRCKTFARFLDASDLVTFSSNVIVNSDSTYPDRIWMTNQSDATVLTPPAGVTLSNNLAGAAADGIIDSNMSLQGTYRAQYLGTRGHEIP